MPWKASGVAMAVTTLTGLIVGIEIAWIVACSIALRGNEGWRKVFIVVIFLLVSVRLFAFLVF